MGAQISSLLSGGEAANCRECRDGIGEHASHLQGCFKDISCGCGSGLGEANREQRKDHSQHQRRGLNAVEKSGRGGYEISKLRHELDNGDIQGTVHTKAFGVEHFDRSASSVYLYLCLTG